jgi:shikimate kinase
MSHAYGENSVRRGESIMCAPQVPQRRLVIANGGGKISYQYHGNKKLKKNPFNTNKIPYICI